MQVMCQRHGTQEYFIMNYALLTFVFQTSYGTTSVFDSGVQNTGGKFVFLENITQNVTFRRLDVLGRGGRGM